jgi:hypothetical protein
MYTTLAQNAIVRLGPGGDFCCDLLADPQHQGAIVVQFTQLVEQLLPTPAAAHSVSPAPSREELLARTAGILFAGDKLLRDHGAVLLETLSVLRGWTRLATSQSNHNSESITPQRAAGAARNAGSARTSRMHGKSQEPGLLPLDQFMR